MGNVGFDMERAGKRGGINTIRLAEPSWFREQWNRRPERVGLVLILALALALRLVRLGTWSYWHDEVHNLVMGERFREVLAGEFVSNHPPFFSFLVMLWQTVGMGESEWTMRLLVVILGLAGIVSVYILARHLLGAPAALAAAFLLAINPLHLFHSQDLKEYMVLPVTAPIMGYFLYRAVEENRPGLWALYGLWAGIACYSELFVGPLLVALNLWALARIWNRRDRIPGWILGNLFGALLFVPQLGLMLHKANRILRHADEWWVREPDLASVAFYLKAVAFGYSDREPHFKIALVLFGLLVCIGLATAARRNRTAAVMLLVWFIVPVALVYAGSHLVESFFLIRAMIPYALALYILAGAGVAAIRPLPLRGGVALLVAVVAAFSLADRYQGRFPLNQWPHRPGIHAPIDSRGAARFVVERWREGDILLHASPFTWMSFYQYGFRERPQQTVGASQGYIDIIESGNPRMTQDPKFLTWFPRHVQEVAEGRDRLWYVFADWHREFLGGNTRDVWRWLDAHYTELAHARFDGLEVFLFARTFDGAPVTPVARTKDDGVEARLTYRAGDRLLRYRKILPDSGLVPSAPEERRGGLRLSLEEDGVIESPRTVTVRLDNTRDVPVSVRVEFLFSDAVIEAAGLYQTDPSSDRWRIVPRHNPQPPPPDYEVSVVAGRRAADVDDSGLFGTIPLDPGAYGSLLYLADWPAPAADGRSPVRLELAGVSLLDGPRPDAATGEWTAWPAAPVTVPEGSASVPIQLSAPPESSEGESWFNLGYIALVRAPADVGDFEFHETVVPPRDGVRWSLDVPASRDRVDVWVYERGEDGRVYRTFKVFDLP